MVSKAYTNKSKQSTPLRAKKYKSSNFRTVKYDGIYDKLHGNRAYWSATARLLKIMRKAALSKILKDNESATEFVAAFLFSDRQFAKVFAVSKTTANRWINRWIDEGILMHPFRDWREFDQHVPSAAYSAKGVMYRRPMRQLYAPMILKWAGKKIKQILGKREKELRKQIKYWIDLQFRIGDGLRFIKQIECGAVRLIKYWIRFPFGRDGPQVQFERAIDGKQIHYIRDLYWPERKEQAELLARKDINYYRNPSWGEGDVYKQRRRTPKYGWPVYEPRQSCRVLLNSAGEVIGVTDDG